MIRCLTKGPWFYALGGFLALAMGSLLLTYTREPAYVQALHAQGMPASWEDLQSMHDDFSPQENGAPLLLEAVRVVPRIFSDNPLYEHLPYDGEAVLPPPWEPIPASIQSAVREVCARSEVGMESLSRALSQPVIRFEKDFSQGFNMRLHHMSPLRAMARILMVNTLGHVLDSDQQRTADSLRLQLAMDKAIGEPTFLIEEYLRDSMLTMYTKSLHEALNRIQLTPTQLHDLQQATARFSMRSLQPKRDALTNESGQYVEVYDRLEVYIGEPDRNAWVQDGLLPRALRANTVASRSDLVQMGQHWIEHARWRVFGTHRMTQLLLVRALRVTIANGTLPPHEAGRGSLIEDMLEGIPTNRAAVAMFMAPLYDRSYESSIATLTQLDLGQVALAVLRYRANHGEIPITLTQLVPAYIEAVPIDAFSGEPPRYVRKTEGFIVYSVGYNRKDDGGTKTPEKKNRREEGDVLFEVRW